MYAEPQLPKTTIKPMKMENLPGSTNSDIFNRDINCFNYRPVMMQSAERSHYYERPQQNPEVPRHPLHRYSSTAYYDPEFESLEYDRLQFRGNLPRAIDSGVKNKSGYNVMIDALTDKDYMTEDERATVTKLDRIHAHQFKLNDEEGTSFDKAFNGIHEENRYRINDTLGSDNTAYMHRINDPHISAIPLKRSATSCTARGTNDVTFHYSSDNIERPTNVRTYEYNDMHLADAPLYPEIYPYVQREGVDGISGRFRSRIPAGHNFSNCAEVKAAESKSIFSQRQDLYDEDCQNCTKLSSQDKRDIRSLIEKSMQKNKSNKKESFLGLGTERFDDVKGDEDDPESFENPIAREADYTYMSALKIRANAVCEYLRNNKAYKKWSHNWDLLKSNLNGGRLFARLGNSDADIAYVVNKGEEIKFRIRDLKRYTPINIYQYVLYHEMAHMSTSELQHTDFFMKLLNIISLAGFECGFIDFKRLPTSFYLTDGKPILCRDSMKEEVIAGAEWLREANPKSARYYDGIIAAVEHA